MTCVSEIFLHIFYGIKIVRPYYYYVRKKWSLSNLADAAEKAPREKEIIIFIIVYPNIFFKFIILKFSYVYMDHLYLFPKKKRREIKH